MTPLVTSGNSVRAWSGKVEAGFPSRQTRNAFARRSCSKQRARAWCRFHPIASCSSHSLFALRAAGRPLRLCLSACSHSSI